MEVDESLIEVRIEYMCSFQDKLGKDLGQRWCTGIVRRISDEENPRIRAGATRRACYKAGEAVEANWDAIPDADMLACVGIVALNPRKWNKDAEEAWRKDYGV